MNYDVNYFIKKFEAITSERWAIKTMRDTRVGFERRCALGHCIGGEPKAGKMTDEIHGLMSLSKYVDRSCFSADLSKKVSSNEEYGWPMVFVIINNGEHPKYQQPHPKQRILAALYDIKKLKERVEPVIHELPAPEMTFTKYEKMKEETKLIFAN